MKRKNPFASGQEKHQDKKHAAPMSIDEGKTEPEDSRTTTDAAKDPGAPDNEDDLIEAVVLRQEDLVPPREKFSWSPSLATAPWSEQYTALEHFRQSIKFHPSSIQTAAFPDAEACLNGLVVPSAEHLRSALSRSGLYCISEYVQCVGESATVHSGLFIPVLLRRSINEKRFIRDAAHEALDHVATCCSPLELLQVLVSFSNDKNPNLVATVRVSLEIAAMACHVDWADNVARPSWIPSKSPCCRRASESDLHAATSSMISWKGLSASLSLSTLGARRGASMGQK
ncbi:hypothetical protein H310_09905 [Aphanomyces invadans]|uniref:CLASP N-terminal domain-containing protein n=1 Tax=Aphanomyces invadans TaxID=157072 RepID=A0A024TSV2_9STRA|nr:hypothetical protein H310_09905 [Aphanomyces invadans]ETV97084.1 hypothetical protein H310_09905 [Aphanomyces invadans]|eukprot:XP_008874330.1 hypothetical protein H310_09905 [Aphanomyces invadans]